MKTLYDFLGALPDDDAESLRVAFRNAAKGTHPDLNPGDPNAALRFRQLVRANEILSDEEQRAAYDHLLDIARLGQEAAPKRAAAAAINRLANGIACCVIALAGVLVASVGGNVLFVPINGTPLAPTLMTEVFRHEAAQATAVSTELSETLGWTDQRNTLDAVGPSEKLDENPEDLKQAMAPSVVALARDAASATASAYVPRVRDFATNDAKHYRERGILAYRSGDLYLALIDFDLAIQFDPGSSDAYIDRAIVFYRMGDQKRAFADVAQAKRIDHESNRNKSLPTARAP